MKGLAGWVAVVVPSGVYRGRTLGQVLHDEHGPDWIEWASRTHADPEVRQACYGLAAFLTMPSTFVVVPELVIRVPLEGPVRVCAIAASDDDVDRLAAQVRADPGQAELVQLAIELAEKGSSAE